MDGMKPPIQERPDTPPSKARSKTNNWIIGLALLLGGGILLIQNLVGWRADNWWFILLLVPAVGAFATAWKRYRDFGRTQRNAVIRPVIVGVLFLVLGVGMFLNLKGPFILAMLLVFVGLTGLLWVFLR